MTIVEFKAKIDGVFIALATINSKTNKDTLLALPNELAIYLSEFGDGKLCEFYDIIHLSFKTAIDKYDENPKDCRDCLVFILECLEQSSVPLYYPHKTADTAFLDVHLSLEANFSNYLTTKKADLTKVIQFYNPDTPRPLGLTNLWNKWRRGFFLEDSTKTTEQMQKNAPLIKVIDSFAQLCTKDEMKGLLAPLQAQEPAPTYAQAPALLEHKGTPQPQQSDEKTIKPHALQEFATKLVENFQSIRDRHQKFIDSEKSRYIAAIKIAYGPKTNYIYEKTGIRVEEIEGLCEKLFHLKNDIDVDRELAKRYADPQYQNLPKYQELLNDIRRIATIVHDKQKKLNSELELLQAELNKALESLGMKHLCLKEIDTESPAKALKTYYKAISASSQKYFAACKTDGKQAQDAQAKAENEKKAQAVYDKEIEEADAALKAALGLKSYKQTDKKDLFYTAKEQQDRSIEASNDTMADVSAGAFSFGDATVAVFTLGAIGVALAGLAPTIVILSLLWAGAVAVNFLLTVGDLRKNLNDFRLGKFYKNDDGEEISDDRKSLIKWVALLPSVLTGIGYGVLSFFAINDLALKSVMGWTSSLGVSGNVMLGGLAFTVALFPPVCTAIALASIFFVVISDLIKNWEQRTHDIWMHFFVRFVSPWRASYVSQAEFGNNVWGWRANLFLERGKCLIHLTFEAINLVLCVSLLAAITIATAGLMYTAAMPVLRVDILSTIVGWVTSVVNSIFCLEKVNDLLVIINARNFLKLITQPAILALEIAVFPIFFGITIYNLLYKENVSLLGSMGLWIQNNVRGTLFHTPLEEAITGPYNPVTENDIAKFVLKTIYVLTIVPWVCVGIYNLVKDKSINGLQAIDNAWSAKKDEAPLSFAQANQSRLETGLLVIIVCAFFNAIGYTNALITGRSWRGALAATENGVAAIGSVACSFGPNMKAARTAAENAMLTNPIEEAAKTANPPPPVRSVNFIFQAHMDSKAPNRGKQSAIVNDSGSSLLHSDSADYLLSDATY